MADPKSEPDCMQCRHRREPQNVEVFIESTLGAGMRQQLETNWKHTTERQSRTEATSARVPELPRYESWCSWHSEPGKDSQSYRRVQYALCRAARRNCQSFVPIEGPTEPRSASEAGNSRER